MLSSHQQEFFAEKGYLVVENVFDQTQILNPIRAEYNDLLDQLIEGWIAEKLVPEAVRKADFFEKLSTCYEAGCDWFQPMDISLPGDKITSETPMHFGPAVFNLLTASKLLDIVEQLIGPEITSNPIQHVRLKPLSENYMQMKFVPILPIQTGIRIRVWPMMRQIIQIWSPSGAPLPMPQRKMAVYR